MATTEQKILTFEQILSADDIEERVVPVPQWGGDVRIRAFSKRQADRIRKLATVHNKATKTDELDNIKLEMLVFVEGVIEPSMDQHDYEKLLDKSAVAIGSIIKAITDASGMTEDAVAAAEKSAENGSVAEVHVPPGPRTEDDGGPAQLEDVSGGIHAVDRVLQT